MKPKIDYEPDGDKGYFRMTLNGVKSGPPLSFTELCSAKFWLENSWPEIVTAVLACSRAEQKTKNMKQRASPAGVSQIAAQTKQAKKELSEASKSMKKRKEKASP